MSVPKEPVGHRHDDSGKSAAYRHDDWDTGIGGASIAMLWLLAIMLTLGLSKLLMGWPQ